MTALSPDAVQTALASAIRLIPPAWPLAATVAVNPYLGHTRDTLAEAGARLGRVGGLKVTMPRAAYRDRIAKGEIVDADLLAALAKTMGDASPARLAWLKEAAAKDAAAPRAIPTVASLVARSTGQDWDALVAERIGMWAAAQFDQGQALWAAARGVGPEAGWSSYAAWRSFATHDLTPEILGLNGFAARVAGAPQRADEALAQCVAALGLSEAALEPYFHALLLGLGGWSQIARWRLWQAEMAGEGDEALKDLLTIRLIWEEALFALHGPRIASEWAQAVEAFAQPATPGEDHLIDAALQEAAERAVQRDLAALMAKPAPKAAAERPMLQAAFCIDVRSEVYRRALETVDPGIETIGFAGFFGLPLSHRAFGSCLTEAHLPVLLSPALRTCVAVTPELEAKEEKLRVAARAKRAWGRFKQAAVSSFAFVEAAGPIYAGQLVKDSLGVTLAKPEIDPAPKLDPSLPLETRITIAKTVLSAMSMTAGFGRVVLLAGHGAQVVNNPHASALHCGACGGQTGEVSARVLAVLLNEPAVRQGLAEQGLAVPEDTLFVGALHDTTTDEITLYAADHAAPGHEADLARVAGWLAQASKLARAERAMRLPRAIDGEALMQRARDWSEVRPEWGLAGCKAFIAAPRGRSLGRSLEGRAFLHSYDWRQDKGFGVLELIITAPVVVASWISLQYYGSTVAPEAFGAGNKLLHNVVGGFGVLEGNGGPLRVGLPWQSVHDGEKLMHDPLRLSVLIEAPREAITDVLAKHAGVRELFDKGWLHLFALDDQGQMAWRYAGDLNWVAEAPAAEVETKAAA